MFKLRCIFEVLGWPPDKLKETLSKFVEGLRDKYEISSVEIAEPEKLEDSEKMYSCFAEFVIGFKDFRQLISFILSFAPAYSEVLEPAEFAVKAHELQDIIADIVAKIHDDDKKLKLLSAQRKQLLNENQKLKKIMNAAIAQLYRKFELKRQGYDIVEIVENEAQAKGCVCDIAIVRDEKLKEIVEKRGIKAVDSIEYEVKDGIKVVKHSPPKG